MAETEERIERLLLVVPYILRTGEASITELCDRFDISRDILLKDLDKIKMCGVPDYSPADLIDVVMDGDRVRILMADYFSRPLRFTRQEGMVLYVAGRALLDAGIVDEGGPLTTALEKILRVLGEADRVDLEKLAENIAIEMDELRGTWEGIIERGMSEGRNLIIRYYSGSSDEETEREVEPVRLVWAWGHWYLYGFCHMAEDKRLFRLDRIRSIRMGGSTGDSVGVREGRGSGGIFDFHPQSRGHRVRLRFKGGRGRRLWEGLPGVKARRRGRGKTEIEFRTGRLEWLSRFLLGCGDEMEVLEPERLKSLLAERARATLRAYD